VDGGFVPSLPYLTLKPRFPEILKVLYSISNVHNQISIETTRDFNKSQEGGVLST